jgi:chaperonin cofactor prefoldin
MTKEELQELRTLMDEVITEKLKPIEDRLVSVEGKIDAMQEDINILKEEAQIDRHTGNLLLEWAEKAERSINVGLYEKD